MISDLRFLNGRSIESTDADNATAVATMPAVVAARNFLAGITADYSAAPAAGFKLITIKFQGVIQKSIRWDPTKEMPFRFAFGADVHADYGLTLSVELAASGTGGVTGRICAFGYTQ